VLYALDLISSTFSRILKARYCSAFDVSADGKSLILAARFKLHVGMVSTAQHPVSGKKSTDYTWSHYMNDEKITCLTTSPKEAIIATGDESGKIKLWNVLNRPNEVNPLIQKLHWHARRVNHICFTPDGRHILSGGDEAVLVIWQPANGQKQFISRLGTEILSITVSPDMSLFALAQIDNSIRIISAVNLAVQQAVVGLKSTAMSSSTIASPKSKQGGDGHSGVENEGATTGNGLIPKNEMQLKCKNLKNEFKSLESEGLSPALMKLEPRHGYVTLEGTPGTVQFYDLQGDCHVMDIAVVPYNYIPGEGIAVPQVTALTFDETGKWMMTADTRRSNARDTTVRFWYFDETLQRYSLTSRIDGLHSVTSAQFCPSRTVATAMVVTTHDDGQFRIWEAVQGGINPVRKSFSSGEIFHWRSRSSGYYRTTIPRAATWAADGSVLAVAFDEVITLWDPASLTLVSTYLCPFTVDALAFGSSGCPYLVLLSSNHLAVWNCLTEELAWMYSNARIRAFDVCPVRDELVVATVGKPLDEVQDGVKDEASSTRLLIFNLGSPVPLSTQSIMEPVFAINCTSPERVGGRQIVCLTRGNQLKVLATSVAPKAEVGSCTIVPTDTYRSVLLRQPKLATVKDVPNYNPTAYVDQAARSVQLPRLLDAPAHALPSIDVLFEDLMESLLIVN
jgi:NET1-associated nuclear protein 1 (U3 small nucleolar RNA-associated protein 17)